MNIATGQVHTRLHKGHTGADVLTFFKQIDKSVPRTLDVHLVLDNLSAHKTAEIKQWLDDPRRKRWHLHVTPTSNSWTNLVERWFKELTDKRLRRGVFTSVTELTKAITVWAEHWNSDPKPSPSSGRPPPKTPSPKSPAGERPSVTSNHRHTTARLVRPAATRDFNDPRS